MQRHRQRWAKAPELPAVEEKEGDTTSPREGPAVGPFFRRRVPKPGYVHPATPMPLARNLHIDRLTKVPKDPNPRVGSMSNLAPATRTATLPGARGPTYFPRFNVTKPAAGHVRGKLDTSDAPKGKKCLQKASPQREWQEIIARDPQKAGKAPALKAPIFKAPATVAPVFQAPVPNAAPIVQSQVSRAPLVVDPALAPVREEPAAGAPVITLDNQPIHKPVSEAPVAETPAPVYHAKFNDPFPYGKFPGLCDSVTGPPPLPPGPFDKGPATETPAFTLSAPVTDSSIPQTPVTDGPAPVYHAKLDDPFAYGKIPGLCDSVAGPPPLPPGPFDKPGEAPVAEAPTFTFGSQNPAQEGTVAGASTFTFGAPNPVQKAPAAEVPILTFGTSNLVKEAPVAEDRAPTPVYHAKISDPFPYGKIPGLCDPVTGPPPPAPGPFIKLGEAARSPQPFPRFSFENSVCLPRDKDRDIAMDDASPPRLAAPQNSSFPSVDVPIVDYQQPANVWAQALAQQIPSYVATLPQNSPHQTSLPKTPPSRKRDIDLVDEPQPGANWSPKDIEMTDTNDYVEQAPLVELVSGSYNHVLLLTCTDNPSQADPFGLNRTPPPPLSWLQHYYDGLKELQNPEARGREQQAAPVEVVVAPSPATPVVAEGHLPEEEHPLVGAMKWTWNNLAKPITKKVFIPVTKYVLMHGGKLAWKLSRKTGGIAYRQTCRLADSAKRRVVEVCRAHRRRNAREGRRPALPERAPRGLTSPMVPRSEQRILEREEEFRRNRAAAARERDERFLRELRGAAKPTVDQEVGLAGATPHPAKAARRPASKNLFGKKSARPGPLRPADGNIVVKKRRAPALKTGKLAPRLTATPSKRPPPSGALRVITPGRGSYRVTDGDRRRNADVLAQWAATSGGFAHRESGRGVGRPSAAPAERSRLRPSIPRADVSSVPLHPSLTSAPVTHQPEENRASPSPPPAPEETQVAIPEVYDEFGGYSSVPVANPRRIVENWLDLEEALIEVATAAPPAKGVESPALVSPEPESEGEESELEEEAKEPGAPFIKPLSAEWEAKIDNISSKPPSQSVAVTLRGDPLTKRDVESCYSPQAWLNDEVINAYLEHIVDNARRAANNHGRNAKPKFHAFNSFFYSNLRDKGYESVRRWATRAKIGGSSLLNVDTVFIPVHHGMHWTLLVVKPSARTIEYFDSLDGSPTSHINRVKTWLIAELGKDYNESEWKILPGCSPQQNNGFDCGVFLLTTAKLCSLDLPLIYTANDIPMIRRKIVAELMNGGFDGDFSPSSEFAGWGKF